jgi:Tol biopolymer transport system component
MNADGTNRHSLGRKGWEPSWSPDGTKIAYVVGWDELHIMNTD